MGLKFLRRQRKYSGATLVIASASALMVVTATASTASAENLSSASSSPSTRPSWPTASSSPSAEPMTTGKKPSHSANAARLTGLEGESQRLFDLIGALPLFTGITIDHESNSLIISVTDPKDPAVVSAVRSPKFPVSIRVAKHGFNYLEHQTELAGTAISKLRDSGLSITNYGPNVASGEFEVGVRHKTPLIEEQIRASLGDDVVVYDTSNQTASSPYFSRSSDVAPWYGGDLIRQGDGASQVGCSGGFIVHSANGYDYMATAGHCFDGGTVYNGGSTQAGAPSGSGMAIGPETVSNYNDSSNGYVDEGFIRLTDGGAGRVYSGYTSTMPVGGNFYAAQGDVLCVDGAYSDQRCGGTVLSSGFDGCAYYDNGTKACHVFTVSMAGELSGPGDSGGPVYLNSSGSVFAAGIVSGGNRDTSCVGYNQGDRAGATACGNVNYVTDWQ